MPEEEKFITLQSSSLTCSFNDLTGFTGDPLNGYRCEICSHLHKEIQLNLSYDFKNNSCVVLKFKSSEFNGKVLNLNINDFDENHVIIPGDMNKNIFVVKAAIKFRPFNLNNADEGGHFVCSKKVGAGWLEVSDTIGLIVWILMIKYQATISFQL